MQKTIRLGWWNGEEYGLYGSVAHAKAARNRGDKIIAYLNTDMNCYRRANDRTDVAFIRNDSTADRPPRHDADLGEQDQRRDAGGPVGAPGSPATAYHSIAGSARVG